MGRRVLTYIARSCTRSRFCRVVPRLCGSRSARASTGTRRNSAEFIAQQRKELGLDQPDRGPVVDLAHQASCTATSARASRTNDPVSGHDSRTRCGPRLQLMFWGTLVLGAPRDRARRVLGGEAVLGRRLHVHRHLVRRASRCPTFLFGLLAIALPGDAAQGHGSTSTSRSSTRSGCTRTGQSGLQPRLPPPHLSLPVLALDGAERRGVEPLPARRRCSTC